MVTFIVELPTPLAARVTVEGLMLARGPEGEIWVDRLIVPVNPLRVLRPIVDEPDEP